MFFSKKTKAQSKWCEMLLCEVSFATKHKYRTLRSALEMTVVEIAE